MQTIWLQRSSPDIPWGFRLVGGREFGVPLSVQRVTPGSIAASALGPGDVLLKVGNVMTTNLEHNDAQELVRQATNILQLTIRKADKSSPSGPLSPSGYGTYATAQQNDNSGYGTTPRSFGTSIPLNTSYNRGNETQNYATTPRNNSSQQPLNATRIEITRVNPAQQQRGYSNNYYNDDSGDTGGSNFPDYTIAYRNQEPVHDSPGGPVNVRGYPQNENIGYSSKSLPRDAGGYNTSDRDGFGGASGPPAYEPRGYTTNQSSFSPRGQSDTGFSTGVPFQQSYQKPQQTYSEPASQSYQNTYNQLPGYGSAPGPFSPSKSSAPVSQRNQQSSYNTREPSNQSVYNQTPTQSYSKPTYSSNDNSYNSFTTTPQSAQSYRPSQVSSGPTYEPPAPFSGTPSRSYQSPLSPGSSSGHYLPPAAVRRVSFDQNIQENDPYNQHSSFNTHSYKPQTPTTSSNQPYDYGVADYGVPSTPQGRFSRQSSRQDDPYAAQPYTSSGGPLSPRSEPSGYNYRSGYDPSGVSDGIDNINLDSSPRFEPPPPVVSAPPPPPPPPPPGPPPPLAPPLNDWNATPYRRQSSKSRDEPEEQKVPDQLLSTMLKSAKGGGPKPFSYGIDLSELKKKIGPPTAPKPRSEQPGYNDEEQEMPRQYGSRPPRKPAGYVQSDYVVNRGDDSEPAPRGSKKPAGQIQSDYFQSRQTGPRSEIDESPININMGTDPKKQSKSFKVLQWMTETDKEAPEEPSSQKPRRPKDPERRHNAADDEMRFSGLHSKADIPSKAFGILQRIASDDGRDAAQNGKDAYDAGEADEQTVGNYDETSIRYKGKNIPSPSFRVLQTWAQHDPEPVSQRGGGGDEEDDNLPDTLNSEDLVDKRYKGGNIPSKVFKVLQKSVGEDSQGAPSPPINRPSGGQSGHKSTAPITDF